MVTLLIMSVKMATLGLFKINVFWNKVYDVITSVDDVANKILSCDSNYITDLVTWSKFVNSFFEGWYWFKLNNFELALVMALKFYASVTKGWELKNSWKFLGLSPTFVEVMGKEKTGRGTFLPLSWIRLSLISSLVKLSKLQKWIQVVENIFL